MITSVWLMLRLCASKRLFKRTERTKKSIVFFNCNQNSFIINFKLIVTRNCKTIFTKTAIKWH